MSDGALFKPEKDFSKEADKVLPEAEAIAKVNNMVYSHNI
jgi:26S proteasome regulatory subunit N5